MPATAAPARELATEDLVAAFGPEHPAVVGPRLLLTLDGEQVTAARVELGYRHRGLEKLAERSWSLANDVAARLDPLAPHAGAAAYARALEQVAGLEIPLRAARPRLAVLELERAAGHLAWLGRLAIGLELLPTARQAAALRRCLVSAEGALSGQAGGSFIVPGGVRSAVGGGDAGALAEALSAVRRGLARLDASLGASRLVGRRLDGLGRLEAERAGPLGASGPVLRASGVPRDARVTDPAYAELGFEPVVRPGGDSLARYAVRLAEIGQALDLAERATASLPGGPCREPLPNPVPAGEAYGWVEGPRGELGAFVVADGDERPRRVAFRGPSLAHAMLLPDLLAGCRYADVPLLLASLDLSMEEAER